MDSYVTRKINNHRDLERLIKRLTVNHASIKKMNTLSDGKAYAELIINLSSYNNKVVKQILDCVGLHDDCGFVTHVKIVADGLDFTQQDFLNFIELEESVKEKNAKLTLVEDDADYSVEQALNAYIKCKDFAEYVKSTGGSPFEMYLMIYRFVTNRVYKDNEENLSKARDLISILNNEEIVCVGYAKLLKYLCESVGIKCKTQLSEVYEDGDHGRHENNYIYLKDEKYGIDGYYYADACWDCILPEEEPYLKYNYAFLPFSDVQKMDGVRFRFEDNNQLYNNYRKIDYLTDVDMFYACAHDIGFKFDNSNMPVDDYVSFVTFYQDIVSTSTAVKQKLQENNVPADLLSTRFSGVPDRFSLEFLIAMEFAKPDGEKIVDQIIKEMLQFSESEGNIDLKTIKLGLYSGPEHEDIYASLDEFKQTGKNLDSALIERYYECYNNYNKFMTMVENMKATSTPISSKVFVEAMVNSLKLEGCDEEQAIKMTRKAIKVSADKARSIFKKDADNCFYRLNVRNKSIDREKEN